MTRNAGEIAHALAHIRAAVAASAARVGREASEVEIVAVSKRHAASAVAAAFEAGQRAFGESYAQELAAKAAEVAAPVTWHFIGTLQRNKAKVVVGLATLIHAVDSARLARALEQRAAALEIVQPVLVEVNVGGEAHKGGVPRADAEQLVAAIRAMPHLRLDGLMTMPPLAEAAEDNRVHFAALRALRDRLARAASPLPVLSMGTTSDYQVAVEEGATLVRVGTAIFGTRESAPAPL